jgi:hypothetical protein
MIDPYTDALTLSVSLALSVGTALSLALAVAVAVGVAESTVLDPGTIVTSTACVSNKGKFPAYKHIPVKSVNDLISIQTRGKALTPTKAKCAKFNCA